MDNKGSGKDNTESNGNQETNQEEQSQSNQNATNNSGEAATPSREELIKQLKIINLSISTIYIVVLAIFLNIEYLQIQKAKLLDTINGTSYAANIQGFEELTVIAAKMFLLATGIFFGINLNGYNELLNLPPDERDEREVARASNRLLSSLLTFLASNINHNNLTL